MAEQRTIRRTICIGVGGTGRDTLMRLRRLIIDRYGKLSELPVVQFVHIDADKGASESSGLRTGKTYNGEEIIFNQAEKVVATMNGREVDDLARGLEERDKYSSQSPYEHVKGWFPPQLRSNLKAIEEGASGVRPIGRVTYFHNFRKIKDTIKSAENRTIGHEQKMLQKNLIVEPGLNIFVVGSLCGGTGSGMSLDVGYTLRKMYAGTENRTIAYFVISPELYSDTPGINASTYAALKEFNHYVSEGSQFDAMYDPQYQDSVSETRPPFDYIFLVSNQTARGHKILKKEKICNIIAHKIYLDFADELSGLLAGGRDNFNKFLPLRDEHPRRNVQRFLTFGLAKIYFPKERIISICLIDIKIRILNFWLNGEGQSPDAQELLSRFLLNWSPSKPDIDIFRFKLEEATVDNNKSFNSTINNWRDGLEEEINVSTKKKEDRQRISEKLPGEFRAQFRKVQPGENENTRGSWLSKIKQSQAKVCDKFKQDLQTFLNELLDPAKPEFSLNTARSWLEAILTNLNSTQRELEENLQNLGSLHAIEAIEKDWKNARAVFEDIESKKGFFGMKDNRPAEFKEEARKVVQTVHKKLKENFYYTMTQEALIIVKDLQKYIQNLSSQASKFSSLLKDLLSEYAKKSKEIKELNDDEMNGEAIFTDDDTQEYYKVLMPENERRAEFNNLSIKVSERANLNSQFVEFILKDYLIEEKELQALLNETVDEEFGTRSFNVSKSVIKQFLQKHPLNDAKTRLRQIVAEAEPLLPLNTSAPHFDNNPGKRVHIVAFKDSDDREVKQFRDILTEEIGLRNDVIRPIQTDEEIIIVSEYAAFPLRLISNMDRMRNQYNLEKNHPSVHLHTDNRDFIDVIPPDDQTMQKVQRVFYTCIALKALKEEPNKQGYSLTYKTKLGVPHLIELSSVWSEALDQIITSPGTIQTLEELEGKLIEALQKEPLKRLGIYQERIKEFSMEVFNIPQYHPNYPERPILIEVDSHSRYRESLLLLILNRFEAIAQEAQTKISLDPSHTLGSGNNQNQSQKSLKSVEILNSDSDYWDVQTNNNK